MTPQSTDQYTDHSPDQSTDSATGSYGRTDGLTKNSLQDVDQSITSVPHARIPNDHDLTATTTPLRAHPATPDDATPTCDQPDGTP